MVPVDKVQRLGAERLASDHGENGNYSALLQAAASHLVREKELGLEVSDTPAIPCSQLGGWGRDGNRTLLTSWLPVPRILPRQVADLSGNHCQQGGTYMELESNPPPSCSHRPPN